MGGLDPLRVEVTFWLRGDVEEALSRRDIGALFRLLRQFAGASQTRIAIAARLQQGTVSMIMNGEREVTSIDVLERIAAGLKMPDESRMRLGLAPKEVDGMRRRTALGLGLAAALSPSILTEVLDESAAEALEFTRQQAVSSVGRGVLDHITGVVAELDRAYEWQPAAKLFPVARAYRRQVAQLINGRHTLQEARELYTQAAHLSYLLSDLAHDLGSHRTAEAYAIDSYRHADQAGHDELAAWASSSLTCWSIYADQPAKAVVAAERGIAKAPRRSPIAARLHANAARAHARLGNHAAVTGKLTKARKLCDRLPDESNSRLSTESSAMTSSVITLLAADSHAWLADHQEAERHARAALTVAAYSPGRADSARITLSVALTHLGSPDEAVEHAKQAFSQPRYVGSLMARSRELDTALATRYPNEPFTHDFHDRYRHLAAEAHLN